MGVGYTSQGEKKHAYVFDFYSVYSFVYATILLGFPPRIAGQVDYPHLERMAWLDACVLVAAGCMGTRDRRILIRDSWKVPPAPVL